jgi:hypothetical protein
MIYLTPSRLNRRIESLPEALREEYREDVERLALSMGRLIRLRKADYEALLEKWDRRDPTFAGKVASCEGCDWFHAAAVKCAHPGCGVCALSPKRARPWRILEQCPAAQWAG